MRSLVLFGTLLACVSSVPLDAGYGVPAAPLIVSSPIQAVSAPLVHSIPAPAAPLPLQLVHSAPTAPLVHSVPTPVLHSAPLPVQAAAAPVLPSTPLSLAQVVNPLPLAAAPVQLPAPAPIAPAPATLPFSPAPFPLTAAPAPTPLAAAPVPIPATPSSQFHAQDEFGQFSFGYENINSAKTETKDAFGVTRGSYQYVDANGILQTVNYIADPVNGFRVAGTNIPVAPAAPAVALPVGPEVPVAAPLIAPKPVVDTPEVAKAKAEHLAAHAEAKANNAVAAKEAAADRKKREAEPIDAGYGIPAAPLLVESLPVPLVHNVPAPILNHFVHPAPLSVGPAAPLPSVFPDARNFVPVTQVFQPEQFSFVPAPVPEPFSATVPAAAPLPLAPAPAPIPLTAAPAPLSFAAAPAPLPLAAAPAPLPAAPIPVPFSPAPLPLSAAPAPIPLAAAPIPVPSTPSSQFHAQDEFGQFSFGYENINSAKTETKDAFGVTRGSYQYVDANGILQTVNYIADPVNGFRVAGTNIPVAPAAPAVALPVGPEVPVVEPLVAPVPVVETPEVAAARAEHLAAHEEAKAAVAAANKDKAEDTTEAEL